LYEKNGSIDAIRNTNLIINLDCQKSPKNLNICQVSKHIGNIFGNRIVCNAETSNADTSNVLRIVEFLDKKRDGIVLSTNYNVNFPPEIDKLYHKVLKNTGFKLSHLFGEIESDRMRLKMPSYMRLIRTYGGRKTMRKNRRKRRTKMRRRH
jgi:hypothetical protein